MRARNLRRVHGMPYTRKKYIRGIKPVKITKFEMGEPHSDYSSKVVLKATRQAQVRDNALESARITAVRILRDLGEGNYFLKVHVFPHQILRENKMLVGAHADRLQKGMSQAFGKVIGSAARVQNGQILMSALVGEEGLSAAKKALKAASRKFPIPCDVEVETIGD